MARNTAIVLMGVSGAGKSTIGVRLARKLDRDFLEGDTFHPAANVEKMSRGVPLDDDDRRPWLTAIAGAIDGEKAMPDLPGDGDFSNPATSDTAFTESNKWTEARALLATVADDELADPDVSAERLLFRLFHETGVRVFEPMALEERCTCSALKRSYRAILAARHDDVAFVYLKGSQDLIAQRLAGRAGHFMPPRLLDSQFAALEEPGTDEGSTVMTIEHTPDQIVDAIAAMFAADAGGVRS